MKKIFSLLLQLAAACTLFFSACSKDGGTKNAATYTIYSNPVYKNKADVLAAINGAANTAIQHAGKLYIKGNFIYLNDVNKGIHIIDNSNPSHPVQIAFLSIPGNLDIAVKGNILYADMFTDLLALDITNPHQAKLTKTFENFFRGRAYVNGISTNSDGKIAASWDEKDTTVAIENRAVPTDIFYLSNQSKSGSTPGIAGSMAGMVIMNNYLYAISEMDSLGIVDVSNASHPKLATPFFAGFDLQTIYPFEDKLFLGSGVGMFMYDVSDPQHPTQLNAFVHATGCDPVIADGNYAFVTLHDGTTCGGILDELEVIDVHDISNSTLVKTYNLTKPTGLCKDGDLLFVCDGSEVKIFNAANPANLVLQQKIQSNQPYDVIAENKKLIVVNADGISQYDYNNIFDIRLLSFISAKR